MLTQLWTIGMKVANMEQELEFHRRLGNEIVLDETVEAEGRKFRIPLIKMGDRFLHLMEEAVYEKGFSGPLPVGPAHPHFLGQDPWRPPGRTTRRSFVDHLMNAKQPRPNP